MLWKIVSTEGTFLVTKNTLMSVFFFLSLTYQQLLLNLLEAFTCSVCNNHEKCTNMHKTVRHIAQNKQQNFPVTSSVCLFWGPDWVKFDKRHPGLETVTKDGCNDDKRHEASPTRTIADTIVKYQQGQGFLFNTPRKERFKIQAEDIHSPFLQRRPLCSNKL